MRSIRCTECGSFNPVYKSDRFPGFMPCHQCMRQAQMCIAELVGADVIREALRVQPKSLFRALLTGGMWNIDSNTAISGYRGEDEYP